MDDTGLYQRMLASLRQTFNKRLPAGLTSSADTRLQRTLTHFMGEIKQARGTVDEQEVLRESYDSMANWLRKNTEHVGGDVSVSVAAAAAAVAAAAEELQPSPSGVKELATADPPRLPMPPTVQAKDVLQKQEDVVKYRDTEYNIIVSSRDRDWLNSPTTQNRYNFSVQYDGTRPQRTGAQPTLAQRLRNIVRLEFVKAILPVESLRTVIPRSCIVGTTPCAPTATNSFFSVLSYPSVTITLDEYQANNIGTSNSTDRSLAVCQYDATWRSDHGVATGSRGYTLFIPKFMKAQRVYAPTPLSNLQRMNFQITDPDSNLLSTCPDSYRVKRILFGSDVSGSCYADASSDYIFIETDSYFPVWAYSQLDLIAFDGLTYGGADAVAGKTLVDWLQRREGHVVVSVAYGVYASPLTTLVDGANDCAYSNFIIIRNRFKDPATGTCDLDYFTGAAASEPAFIDAIRAVDQNTGGVLNLSRQVQLTLRVITRDYDGASNLRPDNV